MQDSVLTESQENLFDEPEEFELDKKLQQLHNEAILVDLPEQLHYDSLIGNETVREQLLDFMKQTDLSQPRRILIYGAVGVGKTYIVKTLAKKILEEQASSFYAVQSCSLMSQWINQTGKISDIFRVADETNPSTIFFDDIDSVFGGLDPDTTERGDIRKKEFVKCMTTVKPEVGVLAAAAFPWNVEKEVLETFEKYIYIPLPNHDIRRTLFTSYFIRCTNSLTPEDYILMADKTKGFTHFDIDTVCRQAMMKPWIRVQSATHFRKTQGPVIDNPEVISDNLYTACEPGSPDSIKMSFIDIGDDELLAPVLSQDDVLNTLDAFKATMAEEDLQLIAEFKPPV